MRMNIMENDNVIRIESHNRFRGETVPTSKEYDKMVLAEKEVAATNEPSKGDEFMSDVLFDEIKKDMREREERNRKEITDREKRFEKTIENNNREAAERELRYREDLQRQEERFFNDSREREARFNTMVTKIENNTNESLRHIENMKTQNFWGNIALFVGMLAIVVTLIIVI